jgi:hypothetical protein
MVQSSRPPMDLVKRALNLIKHFHPWISLAIFVVAYVLYYLGKFIKSPEALIACGIVVLVSMLERLVNIGTSIDDISLKQEALQKTLYSLADCMNDLHARLKSVKRSNKVIIEHLGLNMTDAWDQLKRVIASCPAREIDCRVLIMTDDPHELGPDAPEDVKAWCGSVPGAIKQIKGDTEVLGQRLREEGKNFKLTLRKYTGTPMIHGVKLLQPFERGYISFASWSLPGSTFEWGGEDYFTFSSGTISGADRRLRELLSGAFEHYWDHTSKEVFDHNNALKQSEEAQDMG